VAAAGATIARRPILSRTAVRWAVAAGVCVALAAASLVLAAQTTYDPTAWLIWGREIVHGELSTAVGPSWKPLPVLVTVPTALLGDTAQQQIWLVVARAGTLAAVALAYRLAWRLEGPVAGVVAAVSLLITSSLLSRTFRGDSEGLLVAVALGAIEAHLRGRRGTAFALVAAATLLRPEVGLFAVGYGLWLLWIAAAGTARRRAFALMGGAGALVVACWLVPEQIGSGRLFRAATRALETVPGSPATAEHPFLATFTNAAPALPWWLYATGLAYVILALRDARRGRDARLPLALAGIATVTMVVAAAMAEAGFTGNIRYLAVPMALAAVVGAAGLVRLARIARARLSLRRATVAIVAGAAVATVFTAGAALRTRDQMRSGQREAALYAALPDAIVRAGGPARLLRCGTTTTAPHDVQAVARGLDAHQWQVSLRARVPGTIVARRGSPLVDDLRFTTTTRTRRWVIASSCAR
jgi:hypothetical protein